MLIRKMRLCAGNPVNYVDLCKYFLVSTAILVAKGKSKNIEGTCAAKKGVVKIADAWVRTFGV
ncbi:MAG: hypothetical protein PHD56_07995 [Anaerostipes sp.]|nr:hypothetical protein [Anaerostipes sp.]